MRILVTGAAGFLGSHLCDRLLALGRRVVGMDNFITGNRSNLEHLKSHPNFQLILHDVANFIEVEGPLEGVLHFASPASPVDYLELPIQTLKVGSLGTHKALGLAKAKGARFLLASTSEVYGDPLVHPQPESYWGNVNPVGPRGVYDEAKRFAEAITMAYHRFHRLDTRIVRIFNTYGPRMRPHDGRVVSNFIVQALKGEPLTVYGDGSQTRSFCYVDDLVEGIVRLFERGGPDPTNIGNPNEFTVRQLAGVVLRLTGSRSRIVEQPLPTDDPKVRQPDIQRAREALGWEPKISLEDGLRRTIEYFSGLPAGVPGSAARRPPPHRVRLVSLGVRRRDARPLRRGRAGRPADLALRRQQTCRGADGARVRASLRHADRLPQVLHGIRAAPAARPRAPSVHPPPRRWTAGPDARGRVERARLYLYYGLRGRHPRRRGMDRPAAAGGAGRADQHRRRGARAARPVDRADRANAGA